MSRLVAIGRRMKISERFTAAPVPAASAPTFAAAGRRVLPRRLRRHQAAGLEPQLAFGHDRLAGLDAALDHHVLIEFLRDLDRALLDGRILLHDEDELAVLAGLHRLRRHDRRAGQGLDPQRHAHEFAGPERAIVVVELRFQLDGVGGRVHGVVQRSSNGPCSARLLPLAASR